MSSQRPPLTDSPWFYALVFSLMGLVVITLMGGRYGRIQERIERKYQANSRIAEERAAKNNPSVDSRIDDQVARRDYSTAGNELIPLWPLAVLLALISCVAAAVLYQNHKRLAAPDQPTQTL